MLRCTAENEPLAPHAGCLCHRPEIRAVSERLARGLSRRGFMAAALASAGAAPALAQSAAARPIAFTNFRLFDGSGGALRDGLTLLVEGEAIRALATGNPAPPEGAQVIDCGGRTLMPGLIDAHWHTLFAAVPLAVLLTADMGYVHLAAAAEAERTLMRGFTTLRDAGGPVFALKQAIDEGLATGPRIYPSGAMVTGTGGHGDFRQLHELPSPGSGASASERTGGSAIIDGPSDMRRRVREQLLQGASQIKLTGSGGVSTPRSPLDALTLSPAEIRAAVESAEDWGTYVLVHAYTPASILRALDAGVRCIEHGHLMDEATAARIAEKGAWLSTQPFAADDAPRQSGPSERDRQQVVAGTDRTYELAKRHGIKTGFGTDILFSTQLTPRQGLLLARMARWYSPAEALRQATSTNAELLTLSGPRNPYPRKLGVIEPEAYADLLVVDGNPLENISLLAEPERSLALIMKNGQLFRNRLG
ncbi:amidohydrolase family protein [Roseococcus sp. YIM B11640]|uniref:metal-dependent hydrolase family protein n=1 Tax=Roseococcus sp. YIM B11640 TaxID=3133973 RepID=UPI003C7CEF55